MLWREPPRSRPLVPSYSRPAVAVAPYRGSTGPGPLPCGRAPAGHGRQHRRNTRAGPRLRKAALPPRHHTMGSPSKQFIVEATGSGVALLDYDQDGWLDIYMVNGSTFDALSGNAPAPHAALFHNNHDGTFTDVAAKAGVTNERWGMGVAVGDYDNDGWPDLFVANFGKNRLYHNNHDGTFTDTAEKAGVQLGNWSSGPTFGDYDGDGRLDLFVSGYVHFDANQGTSTAAANFCQFRGVNVMCGPRGLKG